jgi:hypothetical protein
MGREKFGNPEPVASHLCLLARVFDKSEGDVLEIGTGFFSTLLLHWLATTFKRQVYSYESKRAWYDRNKKYNNEYHHIVYCPNWDELPDKHWGMIFIDHSPNERRITEINKLKADYIVFHDSQPDEDHIYHYSQIRPFKYRYDYKKILPWTSVVSDTKELNDLE